MNSPTPGTSEHNLSPTEPLYPAWTLPGPQEMRQIERSLAYQRCEQEIRSACITQEEDNLNTWYDLDETISGVELMDEAAYLEWRGLLEHHPEHPRWVMIRDEDGGSPLDVLAEAEQQADQALADVAR